MKTDRAIRRRLVDLSVMGLCALLLGGSFVAVAHTDATRARPVAARPVPVAPVAHTDATRAQLAPAPPVAGLIPAEAPRRIAVARRSRAS